MCQKELAETVDRGCPLVLGGPLPNMMAAKAVALTEASAPEFCDYAARIVANARALAETLVKAGATVVTGGTDNHLMLLDVRPYGLTGRQAEGALRSAHLTLNRNVIPYDTNGSWYTSGLRIGTPAVTTLGMGTDEMKEIAEVIQSVLAATKAATIAKGKSAGQPSKARFELDEKTREAAHARAADLLARFPLYPQIQL